MLSNDIYTLLSSRPHNPHYLRRYVKFIFDCIKANKGFDGYTERHHILPASMFPKYKNLKLNGWNRANLTSRQHFIAHWMLWKSFNNHSMSFAFYKMVNISNKNLRAGRDEYKINSNAYERLKEINRQYASEVLKGTVVVKDSNGKRFRVSLNDPRIKSGEVVGVGKGIKRNAPSKKNTVKVIDINGNVFVVKRDDQRFLDGKLKSVMYVICNKTNNKIAISSSEFQLNRDLYTMIGGGKKGMKQSNEAKLNRRKTMKSFFCTSCQRQIKGSTNWERHLKSRAHLANRPETLD